MWHPNAPYATTLEARSAAFPDQPVLVQADGRPGDTASKGFAGRMRRSESVWGKGKGMAEPEGDEGRGGPGGGRMGEDR